MKLQFMILAGVLLSGPALAQTQPWQKPVTPQSPRSPTGPATPSSPAFKPFQGTSTYSPRGGVNAYPDPPKPKPTFTSVYGPDKPKR